MGGVRIRVAATGGVVRVVFFVVGALLYFYQLGCAPWVRSIGVFGAGGSATGFLTLQLVLFLLEVALD